MPYSIRSATPTARPSALRPLDLLPPRAIELQPTCYRSLLARLDHMRPQPGRTLHAGFLLGRTVSDPSESRPSKLLLDRFDIGHKEGQGAEERWEPTVVIRGDVVVPVVSFAAYLAMGT